MITLLPMKGFVADCETPKNQNLNLLLYDKKESISCHASITYESSSEHQTHSTAAWCRINALSYKICMEGLFLYFSSIRQLLRIPS